MSPLILTTSLNHSEYQKVETMLSRKILFTRRWNGQMVVMVSSSCHFHQSQQQQQRQQYYHRQQVVVPRWRYCLALTLTSTFLLLEWFKKRTTSEFILNAQVTSTNPRIVGSVIDGLPIYSMWQVSQHNGSQTNDIWIVYKAGVYDVTSFVESHPGGKENIMLGAGNSIDSFWEIYAQHKTAQVFTLLESFRIGNLREQDRLEEIVETCEDFAPKREFSQFFVHHGKPFNAETKPDILAKSFLTRNNQFFIRNHLSVPEINSERYFLQIEGIGLSKTHRLNLDEIKRFFPKHTVTSVIQCAGNRRNEFNKIKQVNGIAWGVGAIGNARWSGAKLTDVLKHCQVQFEEPSIKHVQFEGSDRDATGQPYGASVPAEKALDPDADFILAYEMNGMPLPEDHGFPVRLVAPGIVGARNVKWLSRIVLSESESNSHWQRNDYKVFPPDKNSASEEEFEKAFAIQELPVQSAICYPNEGALVPIVWKSVDGNRVEPMIEASGYAWSGGGRAIIRVDLSLDGGKTWQEAELSQENSGTSKPNHIYSWTLWKIDLPLNVDQIFHSNRVEIMCRALDSSFNTQPSTQQEIWNFRGLLNNSWHRISVELV